MSNATDSEAESRIAELVADVSWPDLMRDLGEVKAVDVTLDGQLYRLRTDLQGSAFAAFAADGVRPPPVLSHTGTAPSTDDASTANQATAAAAAV